MARKRRTGSQKRKQTTIGRKAKWHNCPNGKRVRVRCGEIIRVGGAIAELPETVAKPTDKP